MVSWNGTASPAAPATEKMAAFASSWPRARATSYIF